MLDLKPQHQVLIQKILKEQLPTAKVWAFGSRVQGRARAYSDLDLAIDMGKSLSIPQLALLREAFEESDLPFRVDLVDLKRVSPQFYAQVMKSAQVF